ncbi:MAG: PEP-CTERM sorting domain-containing protein [Tepidisphaeraceae bacterium]
MNSARRTKMLAAAASLGISGVCGGFAHAQAIFNTQDDFAAWSGAGTGGTVVTNDNFDSDKSQYNGLGTAAAAGAGETGPLGKGSQQVTINAQNNATNPGSAYYEIGLSNNIFTSPDAAAALNGADYIAVDFSGPPANSTTNGSYFELKLIINFDGTYATYAQLDNYQNPSGTFNPMGIAQNGAGQINNGTYTTEYFQDEFITGTAYGGTTPTYDLNLGYYFNSNYNATVADTFSIDNVRAVAPAWNHPGSGDWNSSANWDTTDSGQAPNYQGLEADFLGYVTSNTTVTTSETVNIGTIRLDDSANSYTLAATGSGNITMNMPGVEPALINDAAGAHLISAPVILASSTCVNVVNSADTLTISGAISGTGGLMIGGAGTLGLDDSGETGTLAAPSIGVTTVVNGLGTVKLTSASNTYGGGTTINSGTLIAAVTGALPSGTHVVNNGALIVNGNATLGSLTGTGTLSISPASGTNTVQLAVNSGVATEGGLTIAANSALDITNNHMFITYGANPDPVAAIRTYLINGRNGGSWNGTGGIDSSIAALPANSAYSLGYADSADPGNPAGLSSGTIEVKYTLLGDATLTGTVTGTDFTILATNLGKTVSGWDQGDFLYTGTVTGSDFTALVTNLGKTASGIDVALPAADWAAVDAFAAANGLMADVPEPASAGLLLATGLGIMARRRRST